LNRRATPGLAFVREATAEEFDWLVLLDVLEHVPDDVAVLSGLAGKHLRPRGHALVSVPAWPLLFTRHDVMLGHHRRYRPRQLEILIEKSGLVRIDKGSLFSSLLLPRCAAKLGERVRGVRSVPPEESTTGRADTDVSDWRGGPKMTAAVGWALRQDCRAALALSRLGVELPGLSSWALGCRPETAA
jgi:hypothetical protein